MMKWVSVALRRNTDANSHKRMLKGSYLTVTKEVFTGVNDADLHDHTAIFLCQKLWYIQKNQHTSERGTCGANTT